MNPQYGATTDGSANTSGSLLSQHEEDNRAFMNFINQEVESASAADKTETALVEMLEAQDNHHHKSISESTNSSNNNNSSSRRTNNIRSRLPFLVKQMSTQNALQSGMYEDLTSATTTTTTTTTEPTDGNDTTKDGKSNAKVKWDLLKKVHGPQQSKWDFVRQGGILPLKKKLQGSRRNLGGTGTGTTSKRNLLKGGVPSFRNHKRTPSSSTERLFDFTDQLAMSTENDHSASDINLSLAEFNLSYLQEGKDEDGDNSNSDNDDFFKGDDEDNKDDDVETPFSGKKARRILKRSFLSKFFIMLWVVLSPRDICKYIQDFLFWYVLLLMVPCLGISAILFYYFDNPILEFLPTDASISWWLLFFVRQLVTLHLARATEYIVFVITNRTFLISRILGPFVALFFMQALGWPLVVASWGTWNLCICNGQHIFQKNWLFFLNIRMFRKEYNSDDGILESEFYLRVLFAAIIIGCVTALKRTTVALYLGRRMLQHYRPQLEETLREMELVTEVAELAAETESEDFYDIINSSNAASSLYSPFSIGSGKSSLYSPFTIGNKTPTNPAQKVPTFTINKDTLASIEDDSDDDDDVSDSDNDNDNTNNREEEEDKFDVTQPPTNRSGSNTSMNSTDKNKWNQLKNKAETRQQIASRPILEDAGAASFGSNSAAALPPVSGFGHLNRMMTSLERWLEPEENKVKREQPSILEILKFRKAMHFIQDDYPFSDAFGLANTRKACVKSSMKVYKRLLNFSPAFGLDTTKTTTTDETKPSKRQSFSSKAHATTSNAPTLPFDVIGSLAYNDDGELDENRANELLDIFLPDKNDKIPEKVFVQAIDTIYKKLRFLRAALTNSSKIDSVLEDIFNGFYWGVMGMVVLATLGWDPWPLLVSFSSLVVSFAFALGPSMAKYIEGILLIAIRRPYDIGDRITISSAESVYSAKAEGGHTWLVQDITLTTTTLRFAASNEISTINNFSIANSRIVNCARSDKPMVAITIRLQLEKALQAKVDLFRAKIEAYLKDRPQKWDENGIIHFRANSLDIEKGFVEYMFRAQHVMRWQDLSTIMIQRGELIRYSINVATEMGILYDCPPTYINVKVADETPIKDLITS